MWGEVCKITWMSNRLQLWNSLCDIYIYICNRKCIYYTELRSVRQATMLNWLEYEWCWWWWGGWGGGVCHCQLVVGQLGRRRGLCLLPGCRLHCIRGNLHWNFPIDFACFSFFVSQPYMLLGRQGDGLIPHIFQTRSVRVITTHLPVDEMLESSHPDEKSSTRMLVVIFRPNVKSEWCQSHTGDISIFLEGQAVTANPPRPLMDPLFVWTVSRPQGCF